MARNPSHRTYERRWKQLAPPMTDSAPLQPKAGQTYGLKMVEPESDTEDRLFVGLVATGVVYCDRAHEKNGDYRRLALHFFDGSVWWAKSVPAELRSRIEADIETHPAGTTVEVSACGQTRMFRAA